MRDINIEDINKLGSTISNGLGLIYYEDYVNLKIPKETNWVEIATILLERPEVIGILQKLCTQTTSNNPLL